jgi:SpoVK/Ycf46/Vps4 family AAA+-type ATPase
LDEAVRRRLVKRLYIPLPNMAGRKQFMVHMIEQAKNDKENNFDMSDQDIEEMVSLTKGYSGADLKCVVGEAALIPIRQISQEDLENIDACGIRALNLDDMKQALTNVKATVC